MIDKREKISLDLDGVVFNSLQAWLNKFNELYEKNGCLNQIRKWNFFDIFGISVETGLRIFDILDKRNYELLHKDAPFYIRLMNLYYSVDILTARGKLFTKQTISSLVKNNIFKGIHYNELHVLNYKGCNKASYDYDIFIDDNPILAKEIALRPNKFLLLMNQPYNQDIKECRNIKRVNDFFEIIIFLLERIEVRMKK